jgi:hypothetical protein
MTVFVWGHGYAPYMTSNLSAGTSCVSESQVLVLKRLHEAGGFGRMAAIRALLREVRSGRRAPKTKNSKVFAAG